MLSRRRNARMTPRKNARAHSTTPVLAMMVTAVSFMAGLLLLGVPALPAARAVVGVVVEHVVVEHVVVDKRVGAGQAALGLGGGAGDGAGVGVDVLVVLLEHETV